MPRRRVDDTTRNERQKSVLLCEVARMNRLRSDDLRRECEDAIARSKKLCEKTHELITESRKRRAAG